MGYSTESSGPVTRVSSASRSLWRHPHRCANGSHARLRGRPRERYRAPDVIVPQAANRPHFAEKPSPGLRGGSIQCCVRVQAGPPRGGGPVGGRGRPRGPPPPAAPPPGGPPPPPPGGGPPPAPRAAARPPRRPPHPPTGPRGRPPPPP